MRQISTTAFLGIIALTITACGSSDDRQSASPAPSTPPVAVSPSPAKPQPPVIAQNPSGTVYLAPSLIQPTNANQRVKQVAKGRRDPFAALFAPTTPIPVSVAPPNFPTAQAPTNSSTTTNKQQASSSSAKASSERTNGEVAVRNSGSTNRQTANPSGTSTSSINPPPPSGLPENNLPPAPPAQLAPELAQNVTVMGVVQIGETTQAIVQVPNEATSRYVQVGQSLSNGQVLVKRIEMNEGAEPLVVFEQYGVEVAKAVGEEPANQNNGQTSPTAALPSPVPQNITTQAVASPSPIPQNITTQTDALSVPPPPPNTPNNGASNQAS